MAAKTIRVFIRKIHKFRCYEWMAHIFDPTAYSLATVTICAGFENSECFGHFDQEITRPCPILSGIPFLFRVISDAVINIPTFLTLSLTSYFFDQ